MRTQGQLTVANGVLFGTTSTWSNGAPDTTPNAALFALSTADGSILTAAGLQNYVVQNGPSIVNDILYQGTGLCPSHACKFTNALAATSLTACCCMPA